MRDRSPGPNGLRRRSRSRSRSRSLPPPPRRSLHRDTGDTWRYSRQQQYHGRFPSPVRRSFGRPAPSSPSPSPPPPPFRRDHGYGDYYGDGGGGPSRTLGSPRRRDRKDADRNRLPSPPRYGAERGSSYRGRGYGYELYKEERERYFGKLSGMSGARTVPGDGVGSRGYFGNLVERSSGEYGRGGGGRYDVSSSTLRAGDDEGRMSLDLGSIPVRYPVSTSVAGADTVVGKIGERGAGSSSLFRESWRSDGYGSVRERYADVGRVSPLANRGVDAGYLKQMEVKSVEGEESDFRGNAGGDDAVGFGGYGDRASRLLARYDGLYATEHRSRVFHDEELVAAQEHSEALLPSKSSFDIETGVRNRKSDWYELDEDGQTTRSLGGDLSDEDLQELPYEENLGSTKFQVRVNARPTDVMSEDDEDVDVGDYDSPGSLSPQCLQVSGRTFSSPQKHFGGPSKNVKERLGVPNDIKKRLGGPARNVKQRLGPIQNVKQRLGPVGNAGKSPKLSWKGHKRLPWVKGHERRTMVGVDKSDRPQPLEADSPVVNNEKPAKIKIEPPEDSEECKKLIQTSFLKFVKSLNENSAYRRRLLEQGGSGSFKCSVCGSSTEFGDTSGLAQHAFQSCKVGFRSEHLGFHRALCVLMGWKCAELPNGSWSRELLPASEAAALKDDLIIWPPVVLVHNSSIAKGNLDERVVVSIDELRNVLKGMGFGHCIANLCRGKAANQSVMVASFTGTFSGLREAERLHKLYAENQHGRAEFEQTISSSCNSTSQEIQRLFTDKVESVLYGYLGTASDLDRLDFETKKKCVVKSKKEIEAIADATLISQRRN